MSVVFSTEGTAASDHHDGLFDRAQQTSIGLVQADLKLGVRIGLINEISLEGSCGQHGRLSFGSRS